MGILVQRLTMMASWRRQKARLVAKGFSQVQGVDYFHTFAPTPSSVSIKFLAAVANEQGRKTFHLLIDVAQASVGAKLDAEIYMILRDGCGDMSGKIVRLNRSLYRLKQSGGQWPGLLVETVVEFSNIRCGNHNGLDGVRHTGVLTRWSGFLLRDCR